MLSEGCGVSHSPGPGLNCTRWGNGIQSEWDQPSRSASGVLASPCTRCVMGGAGVWNPARPHFLCWVRGSSDVADSPRWWSYRASHPTLPHGGGRGAVRRWAVAAFPPGLWWCPWNAPGPPSGPRGLALGVASCFLALCFPVWDWAFLTDIHQHAGELMVVSPRTAQAG